MTAGSGSGGVAVRNAEVGTRRNHWIPSDWALKLEEVEPWPEAVDGKALVDEIAETIGRFVVLEQWAKDATALWVIHTYAFELRGVTTYLGIQSPQHRCGKSTLLDVLGRLVNRPVRAANISTPAFFRAIAETQPALLIDEADTFLHNEELRGILNSGYQREGAFVMRVTHEMPDPGAAAEDSGDNRNGSGIGGPSRLVKFSCWCPKAIARIGDLPQTLADRCITFTMQRKLVSERCERLKDLNREDLRRKCARFVRDHAEEIRGARPSVPEGINDRAADLWEPLLALADLAGGDWPERARRAAAGLSTSAQENDPIGSLLMDILELFLKWQKERVFTKDVVDWLNMSEERPWMVLKRRKDVTGQWVAQQLQAYGVHSKTLRIGDDRAKGYELNDLREAFRRYVPRSEVERFTAELREQTVVKGTNETAVESGKTGEGVE